MIGSRPVFLSSPVQLPYSLWLISTTRRLRPWVVCAWSIERRFAAPHLTQAILPDSYLELVFNLGDAYDIAGAGGARQPAPACYLVGLLAQPLWVQAREGATIRTVAVRCQPWATGLLGVPAAPARPVTPLPLPGYVRLLPTLRRLALAGQYGAAATELLGYLAAHLPQPLPGLAELQQLRGQPAGSPVGAAFAAGGASRRHLERCCRRYAGRSPKQLLQLLRFEQASHYLHAHPQARLAAVAYAFGYADQAHFTRDFRRFSGQSPRQFAAGQALPPPVANLQDSSG